jgi:arylformamidase
MIDWTDAFDNIGAVKNGAALPGKWAAAAAAFRGGHQGEEDLAYGEHAREVLDLFAPEGPSRGTFVYIHGGYWHKFDKSYWSHLARGALLKGWHVAVVSYPLAPEARLSQMTASVARAVAFCAARVPGLICVAGHSAGGHLASRMMCEGVLPREVADRLARVTSISGLHQLAPLRQAKMNEVLQITEEEAEAESPASQVPILGLPFCAWVGAKERPELVRQTRVIEEAWERQGADVRAVYDAGHDHFTVIEALGEPESALTRMCVG